VTLDPEAFQTWLLEEAASLGLDVEQFEQDLNSPELVQLAHEAYEKNASIACREPLSWRSTDRPTAGPMDFANLEATVALTVLQERQFSECPPLSLDPQKQYAAVLHTEKGDITLDLFADKLQWR